MHQQQQLSSHNLTDNNNKNDLNLSVYSQHSSCISTIKSNDTHRPQPSFNKSNKSPNNDQVYLNQIDENNCQDLQM